MKHILLIFAVFFAVANARAARNPTLHTISLPGVTVELLCSAATGGANLSQPGPTCWAKIPGTERWEQVRAFRSTDECQRICQMEILMQVDRHIQQRVAAGEVELRVTN